MGVEAWLAGFNFANVQALHNYCVDLQSPPDNGTKT